MGVPPSVQGYSECTGVARVRAAIVDARDVRKRLG